LIESLILEIPLPFSISQRDQTVNRNHRRTARLRAFFDFWTINTRLSGLRLCLTLTASISRTPTSPPKAGQYSSVANPLQEGVRRESAIRDFRAAQHGGGVPLQWTRSLQLHLSRPVQHLLDFPGGDKIATTAVNGVQGPQPRMKDVEYVLRFRGFYHSTYSNTNHR